MLYATVPLMSILICRLCGSAEGLRQIISFAGHSAGAVTADIKTPSVHNVESVMNTRYGAGDGARTRTASGQEILSLSRLPITPHRQMDHSKAIIVFLFSRVKDKADGKGREIMLRF